MASRSTGATAAQEAEQAADNNRMEMDWHREHQQRKERNMHLYELTDQYQRIMDAVAESDGELSPDLEAALSSVEGDLGNKVNGICGLIQEITRQSDAASAEADRLGKLSQVRHNAAQRLKDYMKSCLEGVGLQKYETDLFKVRIQTNSRPSIAWTGKVEEIPFEFQRVKTELNGTAVYEAWKAKQALPKGFAVTEGNHLRIQ